MFMQSKVFCMAKSTIVVLLLCFFARPLWGHVFVQPPPNVANVVVKARTDTQLTLKWKWLATTSYILKYSDGKKSLIVESWLGPVATHTVSSLSPGTKYSFTLFTVFGGVRSSGSCFTAVTTPSNIDGVTVKARGETMLTFEWDKVRKSNAYTYILRHNRTDQNTPMYWGGLVLTHTVSSLSPGTKYTFTVYTVFEGQRSSGYSFSAVTLPTNVPRVDITWQGSKLMLSWRNNNGVSYILRHSNMTETSIPGLNKGSVVTHTVSSRSPGIRYNFTLYTVFEEVKSRGLNFSAVMGINEIAPPNVADVVLKARTETQLTLEWKRLDTASYILKYSDVKESPITVWLEPVATHTVSSLSPGIKYSFTLFTVFRGVRSSGFRFTAVTTPSNIDGVTVKARGETMLTFEWDKVRKSNAYTYILRHNRTDQNTPMYWGGLVLTHTVSSLSPGTKYTFTVYTVFEGQRSSGYSFSAVTLPTNVPRVDITWQGSKLMLSWRNNNGVSYILRHSNMTETSIPGLNKGSVVRHTVSSLSPRIRYNFTLYTVFEGVKSRGLNFNAVMGINDVGKNLDAAVVKGVRCEYVSGGFELVLTWDAPFGAWTGVEVQVEGMSPQYQKGTRMTVKDLQPAHWYKVTFKLCKGEARRAPVSISCQNDPRDVIAGWVVAVFFIVFVIPFGVFVCCRCKVTKSTTDVCWEEVHHNGNKSKKSCASGTCQSLQRSLNP